MEFYINSTAHDDIDELLEYYPQIEKYNPLIKEYQYDWGKGNTSTYKGLFIKLNSLEELLDFSNKIHRKLIINDNYNMYDMEYNQLNTIEIYDDWIGGSKLWKIWLESKK